jgi:hypothetical protein
MGRNLAEYYFLGCDVIWWVGNSPMMWSNPLMFTLVN